MCQCNEHRLVDLGFTETLLPAGTHICQIYSEEQERDASLMSFLCRGVETRERTACFSDDLDKERLAKALEAHGLGLEESVKSGALQMAGTREVYFADNRFDPDRMLGLLEKFHEDAMREGYAGARVIGEMTPEIGSIQGGSRLVEYESRVSMLLRRRPITTVCQYDARHFDGETIMDVLKVHPMMVVRGTVVQNPFFVPPETVLGLNA